MIGRHSVLWLALAGLVLSCSAATAGQATLFNEVTKDFGSVPKGTLLTHQFRLSNPTRAPLHVAKLRTSCNCATAALAQNDVPPGESTVLAITIDTHKFSGHRTFTIYVDIDRPFVEEARLVLQAVSREDVMLNPGRLDFGRIKKGTPAKAAVAIEYHGPLAWSLTAIENSNGYLKPQVDEVSRLSGQVTYQLTVQLREDLPVGDWHAEVWLRTNDPATPRIRVPLVVYVESALTVTPAEVAVGAVKPGTQSDRKVVVRSAQPFKILAVEGADDRVQVSGQTADSKPVHVLKVTVTAGAQPEELLRKLKIKTDLAQEGEAEFTVQAQIVP
jgi:hypothetical protein